MATVAVVLAAGASRRLGRPKQLLDYRGEPLVRHAASVALGAGCGRTLVIQGAIDVVPVLQGLAVEVVENAEWQEGIASSIRAAVSHAPGARILFTTADQPLVTPAHLQMVLAASARIVATAYAETTGVPAAFGPELQPELRALRGDGGARSIIEAHPEWLSVVRFEDAAFDVDRDEDDLRLRNHPQKQI